MSAPDVLAVMERDAAHADSYRAQLYASEAAWRRLAEESKQARAAVAELIAADHELDAAAAEFSAAERERGSWGLKPLPQNHPAVLRFRDVYARRAAALAACGGAK